MAAMRESLDRRWRHEISPVLLTGAVRPIVGQERVRTVAHQSCRRLRKRGDGGNFGHGETKRLRP